MGKSQIHNPRETRARTKLVHSGKVRTLPSRPTPATERRRGYRSRRCQKNESADRPTKRPVENRSTTPDLYRPVPRGGVARMGSGDDREHSATTRGSTLSK